MVLHRHAHEKIPFIGCSSLLNLCQTNLVWNLAASSVLILTNSGSLAYQYDTSSSTSTGTSQQVGYAYV
eukprot:scaffold148652_cov35-Attheya_sp.AAC.1